jgi:hypothetical protein
VAEFEERPMDNTPDWPAVFDAWVDACVAAAISDHRLKRPKDDHPDCV